MAAMVFPSSPTLGQIYSNYVWNGSAWDQYSGTSFSMSISTSQTANFNVVYILTAALTLTVPATAVKDQKFGVINLSGSTACVIARNGNKIMGLAEDLQINTLPANFYLRYVDVTSGYVIDSGLFDIDSSTPDYDANWLYLLENTP